MNSSPKILHDVYQKAEKAGRAIGNFLTLSLADQAFSFARVVCISIEEEGIGLVCVEKALWRLTVRHQKYYPLEEKKPVSPEHLAAVVAGFVDEYKIQRVSFVLSIPRNWAIVQTVELPLAARENLSRVLSFELDRLTPLGRENAFYDYCVIGEDDRNVKLLLAVVRADQVQQYLDALQPRNIKVKRVVVSSFAFKSLIGHTYPKTDAVYLSLHRGACEYGLIGDSLLRRSVFETIDPGDSSALDRVVERAAGLSEEMINRGRRPAIVLDAGEANFTALRDKFKTGRVLNIGKDIKINRPPTSGDLSVAAMGGALGELCAEPDGVNLLNRDNRDGTGTPFLMTIVLVAVIAAIVGFYLFLPLSYEQKKLDEMDQHIQTFKPAVKKVETLKNEAAALEADIGSIRDFKKHSDLTMDIIRDMTEILPPKTWLTRLRITEKTAEIEGYSSSATDIILKLENSKYFQKVEFASPTFRDPRQNNDRFVIKMELKNDRGKKDAKAEMKNEKKK